MTPLFAVTALLVGAAAGAWLAYFRWQDKEHPEPLSVVMLAVAGGAVAVLGALWGFHTLQVEGIGVTWAGLEKGALWHAAFLALLLGGVEELAKALPVLGVARFTSHLDEELDGFVYASASGIGFALVEALFLFTPGTPFVQTVGRALASPLTHSLFAAPCGLGIARWRLRGGLWHIALGFGLSAVSHGAYDLLLARWNAPLAAAAVVAVLWVWLLVRILKLQQAARRTSTRRPTHGDGVP